MSFPTSMPFWTRSRRFQKRCAPRSELSAAPSRCRRLQHDRIRRQRLYPASTPSVGLKPRSAPQVRSGEWVGATGKPLKAVVAIGIGGSFLGPLFVHTALKTNQDCMHSAAGRQLRFLANVDPVRAPPIPRPRPQPLPCSFMAQRNQHPHTCSFPRLSARAPKLSAPL